MANSPPTVIAYNVLASGNVDVEYSDGSHAIIPGAILIGTDGNPYSATGGGGGGGGGAVTVADGADVALGHLADASSASTVIGLLKNLKAALGGTLAVSGTFWQATQPISGTVTSNAGTNLNTSALALEAGNLATLAGAVSSSKVATKSADGDNVTIGAKADAKSTATDVTAISAMSVWKQISASVQAIATSIAGTVAVSIASAIAVTQSGTWTVQPGNTANTTAWKVDGSAVTQPVSGTVTANAGSNMSTASLALETGGNLALIKADTDKIPSQGSAAASASTPVAVAIPENSVDSQVSIATSSTVLLASRAKRKRAIFKNTDAANPIFINFANGTATTTNFPLKAGESIEMQGSGATKAISTGASVNVSVIEEYYS